MLLLRDIIIITRYAIIIIIAAIHIIIAAFSHASSHYASFSLFLSY